MTTLYEDESTDPEELLKQCRYACDLSTAQKKALAGNPSTPLRGLLYLVDESPDMAPHVWANVMWPFLSLDLDQDTLRTVLSHAVQFTDDPALMELGISSTDPSVREFVAENVHLSEDMFNRLADDPSQDVQITLSCNKRLPDAAFHRFVQEASRSTSIRICLARDPRISPVLLDEWSRTDSTALRKAVASNPLTPPEALRRLASHGEIVVKVDVACNPSTPRDLLEKLSDSPYIAVANEALRNMSGINSARRKRAGS